MMVLDIAEVDNTCSFSMIHGSLFGSLLIVDSYLILLLIFFCLLNFYTD